MDKKTVLFIDDEEHILDALERSLVDEPYQCIFTSDPNIALDILESLFVDMVVADLRMPGLDGLTLLSLVRSSHPGIKQVVLSGHEIVSQGQSKHPYATRTITFDEGEELHMLAKPWNAQKLKALIRETLDIEIVACCQPEL